MGSRTPKFSGIPKPAPIGPFHRFLRRAGLRKLGQELGYPLHVQRLPMLLHTAVIDQERIVDYRSYLRCATDLHDEFLSKLLEEREGVTGLGAGSSSPLMR